MSRREDFDNALWSDPEFLSLTPEARMTYIWSWTNPRCGMAGIYKVALTQAALETGYDVPTLERSLVELAAADFAFYERNVLLVRTRARRLRTKSEQIAKSIRGDLLNVADDHPLKVRFLEMYAGLPWLRDHIGEARSSVTGTSGEAHGNPRNKPTSVNLTRTSGEPRSRLHGNGNGNGPGGRGGAGGDSPPDDFPPHLLPTLPQVVTVLRRIAGARSANDVTTAAAARAMASYPRRPHVKAAEDLEHWLVHGTGQRTACKDVVAFYRNQLDRRWQDVAPGARAATGNELNAALSRSFKDGGAA